MDWLRLAVGQPLLRLWLLNSPQPCLKHYRRAGSATGIRLVSGVQLFTDGGEEDIPELKFPAVAALTPSILVRIQVPQPYTSLKFACISSFRGSRRSPNISGR